MRRSRMRSAGTALTIGLAGALNTGCMAMLPALVGLEVEMMKSLNRDYEKQEEAKKRREEMAELETKLRREFSTYEHTQTISSNQFKPEFRTSKQTPIHSYQNYEELLQISPQN